MKNHNVRNVLYLLNFLTIYRYSNYVKYRLITDDRESGTHQLLPINSPNIHY